MRLYVYRGEAPSNRKVGLGPKLFRVGEHNVLDPQPTPAEIASYMISTFVALVDVPDPAPLAPPASVETSSSDNNPFQIPPPENPRVAVDINLDDILDSYTGDGETPEGENPNVLTEERAATAPPPPTELELDKLSARQLRALADQKGIAYPPSISKTNLLALLRT